MAEMEIETDDDILRRVAIDGSMDYTSWPALLLTIVSRIEQIAHNDFPIPHIPPPRLPPRPASPRFLTTQLPSSDLAEAGDGSSDTAASSQEQENNKENASPTPSAAFSHTATNAASSSSSTVLHSSSPPPALSNATLPSNQDLPQAQNQPAPPPQPELPLGTLPTPVAALLSEVTSTLTLNFTTYPPHTIQRLAELVLRPRQHYRSVVSYLHALDRVVHVTSGANIYPLPPAVPDMGAMSVLANGIAGAGLGAPGSDTELSVSTAAGTVGTDEALGGALLTPIPWLARRANGGAGAARGGGSSDDGSSDAGTASPLSSGSSSGGGSASASSAQQQQRQSATPTPSSQANTTLGSGSGRKPEPQLRTESTETIEGPNGMGSIETVSISVNGIPSMGAALTQRGVTQGELLRQEQRAGVVPVSQLARHGQSVAQQQQVHQQGTAAGSSSSPGTTSPDEDASMDDDGARSETAEEGDDEVPHARGPEEIGAADTGPQRATSSPFTVAGDGTVEMHGIDVEAAVGRRIASPDTPPHTSSSPEAKVPRSPKREATEDLDSGAAKKIKEDGSQPPEREPKTDAEGDVVIGDDLKPPSSPVTVKHEETPVEDKAMTDDDSAAKVPINLEASPSE
ncbi:hypothetical protein B0T16DRAFT_402332 [Cercophora newfieldiana]|uniref:Uncharacterized protein n=1 Tax=Cercophora newfieldiana TaxID=92897 RepID=A0AA40D2C8_9PEZI|nr:hypothetical protein B0T16DRAFT_402332 [Cercophora newfieldiana]